MRQRLRLAEFLHAQFQRRGIALLMLPVPDKVEQARAQLCGLAVPAQAASRRQAWRAASSALDLPQIDIGPDWPAPGYWRTDSHWDLGGAAFAAAKVAQGVLATATLTPGATVIKEQWGPQQPPQARTGDLARLAKLERNHPPFAPPREYEQALNLDIERGGALFDDTAAPQVLLAGSSYSLNSGFIDYLQLKLGQEVSQQSRVGSGFAGSLLDLLRHPARLDGVKVVVWEWPLRVLYQPLTDDEISHLKQQGAIP